MQFFRRLLKGGRQDDGINTHYRPALRALDGPVAIRETFGGATECLFGQQRDERKASRTRPNYDLFFFRMETHPSALRKAGSGVKMLHEMRPGEMGSMIVSTPVLPRYKIGDLIRAFRSLYFRCIGRDKWASFHLY